MKDVTIVNSETYLQDTTAVANVECEYEPAVFMQAQVNFWVAYSEAHQQGTQCISAESSSLNYYTCTFTTCHLVKSKLAVIRACLM